MKFELCPQWTNSSSCTPMIDPDLWTKSAITATPFSETSSSKRSSKKGAEEPDTSKQVARPLLVLGEAGSGAGLVAQLLRHSTEKYMLWREPNSWRFSSRIPDTLLGEMLASLYTCELSSQQLAWLHTQASTHTQRQGTGRLPPSPKHRWWIAHSPSSRLGVRAALYGHLGLAYELKFVAN
eukprot:6200076-Pleurochrysis_carterae.AAC.10